IVLLNLVGIDLRHSPNVSLVTAQRFRAEILPPNGPRKSSIEQSWSQSHRTPNSTFVLKLLLCWKQPVALEMVEEKIGKASGAPCAIRTGSGSVYTARS